MPGVQETCIGCGKTASATFGEVGTSWPSGLSWWRAFQCLGCGSRYETDGHGPLPDSLRGIELAESGLRRVEIDVHNHDARLLLGLAETMGLDAKEAAGMTGGVLAMSGTQAEAERIAAVAGLFGMTSTTRLTVEPAPIDIAFIWKRLSPKRRAK